MEVVTIGLALGVGAARGWAHIGVIQGLVDIGIRPDVVCGTSAGALVGGSYAAGHLEELEKWLLSLDRLSVARFFDLSLTSGGLIAGKRIIGFFVDRFGDYDIQSLPKTYGAVASEHERVSEMKRVLPLAIMSLYFLAIGCASTPTPQRGPLNFNSIPDGIYTGSATNGPAKAVYNAWAGCGLS